MKMASKCLSFVMITVGLLLLMENRAFSMAQISLQNNTSFWLNFYIDGNFGCGPVMPSGFCTSSVNPGARVLEARKRGSSEPLVPAEVVNIGDGTSPTWTVNYEDPDQAFISRLNGARFVSSGKSPMIAIEEELIVDGTTMVWRKMVSYAAPNVRKAILSGTGGFWNRTVGQWEEYARMQIVAREARHRRVTSYGAVEHILTINEDGNSIAVSTIDTKFGKQNNIFNRERNR